MPFKKTTYSKKPTTTTRRTYRRTNKTVKGKGAYSYSKPGPWGKVGRAAGSIIGRHFGGSTGAAIGSKVGGLAHYVGRIFGSGEYRIGPAPRMNSLFKGSVRPSNLSFGDRYVNLKHREYLGDVISSATAGDFNISQFEVNPGMIGTFPYLAAIARNFQMYRFKGLLFEFVSTSGSGLSSTNTALGTVTMVPEYNVYSPAPRTKMEMLNTEGSVSGKPSDSLLCGIECDTRKGNNTQMFVRALHATDVTRDRRFTDLCNLYVATYGMQGSSINVGQIYVTYDIDLMMPQTEAIGSNDPTTVISYEGTSSNQLPGSDSNWPVPAYNDNEESTGYRVKLGGLGKAFNGIGIVVRQAGSSPGVSWICFPKTSAGSYYSINIIWRGADANCVVPGHAVINGCVDKGFFKDAASATADYLSGRWLIYINPDDSVWQPSDDTAVGWPALQLTNSALPVAMETGLIQVSVERVNPKMMKAVYSL